METNNKLREALEAIVAICDSKEPMSHDKERLMVYNIAKAALAAHTADPDWKDICAKLREAVKCLMDNLNIHLMQPSELITVNRAELDGMVKVCKQALAASATD